MERKRLHKKGAGQKRKEEEKEEMSSVLLTLIDYDGIHQEK